MSTQKQTDANRENAQKSTGATTPEGKLRSSLNATVHGFTGQTLFLTDREKEPYAAFVKDMIAEYDPRTTEGRELLQNYIDLRWSIQQITIQQNNLIAIMSDITAQHMETGNDLAAMDAALEPSTRRLKTLGTYEQRRRKAAKDTLDKFMEVEKEASELRQEDLKAALHAYMSFKKLGQPFDPQEFGFVHSLAQIEQTIAGFEKQQLLELVRREAQKQSPEAGK